MAQRHRIVVGLSRGQRHLYSYSNAQNRIFPPSVSIRNPCKRHIFHFIIIQWTNFNNPYATSVFSSDFALNLARYSARSFSAASSTTRFCTLKTSTYQCGLFEMLCNQQARLTLTQSRFRRSFHFAPFSPVSSPSVASLWYLCEYKVRPVLHVQLSLELESRMKWLTRYLCRLSSSISTAIRF